MATATATTARHVGAESAQYRFATNHALQFAATDLEYEVTRVKSPVLGQDLNPLGRGDGSYYANGGNAAPSATVAVSSAKPRWTAGQYRCGYGSGVNNQGAGGGGGNGYQGDQPCDAPQPGDKCGRYCCIEFCTCPTPKLGEKKEPLDPNCPDCCDDVGICAQAAGPGVTADDCIGGMKGCVVLGSEYMMECEIKKGRGAQRINGGGGEQMPYGDGWPGQVLTITDPFQRCFRNCMRTHHDASYCERMCSGQMLPPAAPASPGFWRDNLWFSAGCLQKVPGRKTCADLLQEMLRGICKKLSSGDFDKCLSNAPSTKSCLLSLCDGKRKLRFICGGVNLGGHAYTHYLSPNTVYVRDCRELDEDELFHELVHNCDRRFIGWLSQIAHTFNPCSGAREKLAFGCEEACYPCSTEYAQCQGDPADCNV